MRHQRKTARLKRFQISNLKCSQAHQVESNLQEKRLNLISCKIRHLMAEMMGITRKKVIKMGELKIKAGQVI